MGEEPEIGVIIPVRHINIIPVSAKVSGGIREHKVVTTQQFVGCKELDQVGVPELIEATKHFELSFEILAIFRRIPCNKSLDC